MKRGLGSPFANERDENYDEQVKHTQNLIAQGIPKSIDFSTPPPKKKKFEEDAPKKKPAAKFRVSKPATNSQKEISPEPEKTVEIAAPAVSVTKESSQHTAVKNGFTIPYALKQISDSLEKTREEISHKAPDLTIAYALTGFYLVSTQMIKGYCQNKVIDPYRAVQKKRDAIQNVKEVTHQSVVDKFDEAQRVFDSKKDGDKAFELIIEAAALCERNLMPRQLQISFTQEFAPEKP